VGRALAPHRLAPGCQHVESGSFGTDGSAYLGSLVASILLTSRLFLV